MGMVPTPKGDPEETAKAKKQVEEDEAMGLELGFDRDSWEANAVKLLDTEPKDRDDAWYRKIKWLLRRLKPEALASWKDLLGFVSIWFKLLAPGKYGWIESGEDAVVVGHVTDVHRSTDGFISLDIDITGNGSITFSPDDPIRKHDGVLRSEDDHAYVRIEINPKSSFATDYLGEVPKVCQWVEIRGPVLFDRDGHFEIHPRSPKDIKIVHQRPVFQEAASAALSEEARSLPARQPVIQTQIQRERSLPPQGTQNVARQKPSGSNIAGQQPQVRRPGQTSP